MKLDEEQRRLVSRVLIEMMEPSEHMIERGRWQSVNYPVVPEGYEDKKPTHPFELRHTFREMVRTFAADNKISLPKTV